MIQLSHPYMIIGKNIALTIRTFVSKVMFLLFNTMSRFVIAFLSRSKRLLISWLQSPSEVIWEHKKKKSVTASTFSPSICYDLSLFHVSFKSVFSLLSFTIIKRIFSSSSPSAIRVVASAYQRLLIFLLEILSPACESSSLAFHMVYSAHNLNKQSDNIQP